jgi:tetratricopeptide (TPR) repeat protein/uncharacterized membrane protein YhaH (DUF805 family)
MAQWLAWLLFDFRGRIPRKSFWLAEFILCAASLAGGLVINGPMLLSSDPVSPWLNGWNTLLLFPSLAVVVKRFNDRGRPAWVAAVWLVVSLAGVAASWFGALAGEPAGYQPYEWALIGVLSIVGLWLFIDLGFLRGQPGSNRHGADPLGAAGAAPLPAQPRRRSLGDNIRDGVIGLLIAIAMGAWLGQSSSVQGFAARGLTWLLTPTILQTWHQQKSNTAAWDAHWAGDKAYREGHSEEALGHFSRAIELYGPDRRTAGLSYRARASVQDSIGRKQEALSDYNKAIAVEPDYVPGYGYRARLLIDLNRYDDAMQDYEMALQIEPDSASTLVDRGRLLQKRGRPEQARADFAQAIVVAHSKYDPIVARAREDRDRNYWTRARTKIIVGAHVGLGDVLRSENRGDEALAEYGKAIEAGPNERFAYVSRGWLHEKQGHLDLARADYQKAARLARRMIGSSARWSERDRLGGAPLLREPKKS